MPDTCDMTWGDFRRLVFFPLGGYFSSHVVKKVLAAKLKSNSYFSSGSPRMKDRKEKMREGKRGKERRKMITKYYNDRPTGRHTSDGNICGKIHSYGMLLAGRTGSA